MIQINKFFPELSGRYFASENGSVYTDYGKVKMSDNAFQNGYIVNSFYGTGYRQDIKRHVLIAEIFLAPPKEGQNQINHIDGNKTNNAVSNLEWCTGQENIHHAWKHELSHAKLGTKCNWAKLTEEDVREIAQLLEDGNLNQHQIADIFGVNNRTISAIKTRKNWKELTVGYNF